MGNNETQDTATKDKAIGALQEIKKEAQDRSNRLTDAFKFIVERFKPKDIKEVNINGQTCKKELTHGGLVIIQFQSVEEAENYYNKI